MTGKTLYDKLWDAHRVREDADGTALLYIDRHLVHEVTSPQAFEGLRLAGRKPWRVDSVLAVPDHNVPTTGRSRGIAGIADPVLDHLIEAIVAARSRAELVTAARAADRVLRAGHYWVPQWYKGAHNLAFWNKFGWPEVKPKYERGALETWWYDTENAGKLKPN